MFTNFLFIPPHLPPVGISAFYFHKKIKENRIHDFFFIHFSKWSIFYNVICGNNNNDSNNDKINK